MKSGIYAIENTKTGAIYVGQTRNLNTRWGHHKRVLRINKHHNPLLQAAWNEYGENAFRFSVLEYCEHSQLTPREQHLIEEFSAKRKCYNLTKNVTSPRYGNGKVTRYSKAEMLAMLNEHKTQEAVAKLIGVNVSSVSRYCADIGIVELITWRTPWDNE